ncbi:MAG: FAD-dependent oxidoreductase [Cereibacter sphaeroides]|uniref:FAD-dependent oxidoreductase n=1 Tax=Cereibacter sphaeroides TaxID=1063 RepID=A0A2W5S223_CERSP|nr:MAG: FAD-dependent oxidoreductase [Cereibacter sphaeroides]
MPDHDAATREDDLRIGLPFWVKTPHSTLKAAPLLSRDRFDVIVVGAGISGALVSEALTRRGKSVLIVDRRPPARGSTAASTAMIQHEIDVPLFRLERQIGKDKAGRAWRRSVKAVDSLEKLVVRLGIDCGMRRKPALYLAGYDVGARELAAEAKIRTKAGIAAEFVNRRRLLDDFGIQRTGAILSNASASANPAQLTAGLLTVARARAAEICSPVEITDMAEMPGGVALATSRGEALVAEHVVFCTGYEFLPQMNTKSHSLTSTWAVASRPLPNLPEWLRNTIVWEASDPYLYFRGEGRDRVIAGGEDEVSGSSNSDPNKLVRKSKVIAQKLLTLTGVDIGTPAYAWSAPFGVTRDGLPIIDRVPSYERVFTVMGFGGNGITFSMIAAEIVAGEIAAVPDEDSDLFSFR